MTTDNRDRDISGTDARVARCALATLEGVLPLIDAHAPERADAYARAVANVRRMLALAPASSNVRAAFRTTQGDAPRVLASLSAPARLPIAVPTPLLPIVVWPFRDAPAELRALSPHCGDEDWIAVIPEHVERPMWTEAGTPFGCCDVSEHHQPDGTLVLIGAHA
jgi:hypothetical protein